MMTDRRTPAEWEVELGVTVLDPDGWDRRNYDVDWARPLTRDEFIDKACASTIQLKPGAAS